MANKRILMQKKFLFANELEIHHIYLRNLSNKHPKQDLIEIAQSYKVCECYTKTGHQTFSRV